ncbi:flagellar protein FliT [Rhodovibrionaceae bacterium A322]
MTSSSPDMTLEREFERLQSMLGVLRQKMTDGAVVDLAGLDQEISALCQKVVGLPAAQQNSFAPLMTSLLSDVSQLTEDMKVELGRLANEIGSSTQRKKAANAYSVASNTGKKR